MVESGADFSVTLQKPNGNIRARISRIKRLSQFSISKGHKLNDSNISLDLKPAQK